MKKIDKILEKTENGLPRPSWTSKTSTGDRSVELSPAKISSETQSGAVVIDAQTKALVNMIFARFMAIYGFKFKSAFETEAEIRIAKREWALSLQGYPESDLVRAVNHCKTTLSWMPTISEFLKILAEINDDGSVPAIRDAFEQACLNAAHPLEASWTHPIVYWAGRATGWFELRSEPSDVTFPRFNYHYETLHRRLRQGENLEQVSQPEPIEDRSSVTEAQRMLDFAKETGLPEDQACKLLYYRSLPKGSKVRARQYHLAQKDAEKLGVKLPDLQP